jgi:hypothetical protein
MSYLSEVMIATTKSGYDEIKQLTQAIVAKKILAGEYCDNMFDYLYASRYNPKADYVIIGWDGVNWGEEYPEIQAVIQALQEASEKYPIRFMRLGEDPGDTEEWDTDSKYTLPDLYMVRYIKIYGADPEHEIDLRWVNLGAPNA